MHVLIVLDTRKQEFSLGAAVYYALDEKGWQSSPSIPFAFWKEFKELDDVGKLHDAIQHDVDYAVVEAEWTKFDYMYVTCLTTPAFGRSN